jgi:hypothetical protein
MILQQFLVAASKSRILDEETIRMRFFFNPRDNDHACLAKTLVYIDQSSDGNRAKRALQGDWERSPQGVIGNRASRLPG